VTNAVRAPGKAMIFGEYSVLDGGTAIVAAVDRYAIAELAAGTDAPLSPFAAAAQRRAHADLAAAKIAPSAGIPRIDSSALYAGGRKLGLGSSAAVTVAAYGAILAGAGRSLEEKLEIFRACDAAHAEAQGSPGSGADIAAAIFGGVIAFRRERPMPVFGLEWPAGIELTLVDTGVAASTADRVARWRKHAEDRVAAHAELVERMRVLSASFFAAAVARNFDLFDLVRRWNGCLDDLARAIDLEIVTPAHKRIAERAAAVGGAAKPSGAGGGDLAICFTPPDGTGRLRATLASEGFDVLDLAIGAPGLSPVAGESR
jgi:phosphomevalonate kinase